jgi:hypothetical protein
MYPFYQLQHLMKKLSFLLLLMMLAQEAVWGQAIRGIGVKAGLSLARQTVESFENNTSVLSDTWNQRKGSSAALTIEWLNLENVSVVTDFGYAQKGSANSSAQFFGNASDSSVYDLRADYGYLQGLLKVRIPIGLVSPYFAAGPRGDIYLDHISKSGLQESGFTPFILGGTFAAGLELKLLRVSLLAEAQYHLDFKDAYSFIREEPGLPRVENTFRNRAVLLQAGLMFHLKK